MLLTFLTKVNGKALPPGKIYKAQSQTGFQAEVIPRKSHCKQETAEFIEFPLGGKVTQTFNHKPRRGIQNFANCLFPLIRSANTGWAVVSEHSESGAPLQIGTMAAGLPVEGRVEDKLQCLCFMGEVSPKAREVG